MEIFMRLEGPQVTAKTNVARMLRALHTPDSLDLNPCDFCAFEMFKQKRTDRHLQRAEQTRDMMQDGRAK
jgi:hypothetical protein